MLLRIDDTDPTRTVAGGEEAIVGDLDWLGVRIAMLGVDFELHEPPELARHLRTLAGLKHPDDPLRLLLHGHRVTGPDRDRVQREERAASDGDLCNYLAGRGWTMSRRAAAYHRDAANILPKKLRSRERLLHRHCAAGHHVRGEPRRVAQVEHVKTRGQTRQIPRR